MSILSLIAEARKRGDTYQFKKDRAETDSQSQSYTFVKVTCKTVPRQLIDYCKCFTYATKTCANLTKYM